MNINIRLASIEDAPIVHDIYGAYLENEHVTFTIDNPSVKKYADKISHTLEKYPFYIAEDKSKKILGYVYGSPLRPHDAYKWNVESTIVLAPDAPRRQGIATALYGKFMDALEKQGYKFVYAVIVDSNEASIAFHKALGFEETGHFTDVGYKLGKWRGIIWMKKALGDMAAKASYPTPPPADPKPFNPQQEQDQ